MVDAPEDPPWSRSEIDRLGKRVASGEPLSDADEDLFARFREHADLVGVHVEHHLRTTLGLELTWRSKTLASLLPKLRDGMGLARVRDVVGLRTVVGDGYSNQDAVVEDIAALFDAPKIIDRRERPIEGYRAVHLEVVVARQPVEIQVRTNVQDRWAQVAEAYADRYGREYRYGKVPAEATPLQTFLWHRLKRIADQAVTWDQVDTTRWVGEPTRFRRLKRVSRRPMGLALEAGRRYTYRNLEKIAAKLREAPSGSLPTDPEVP